MLRVKNVAKSLGGLTIDDVSFDVKDGDYFVLLGASGVGKTVLLETIAGLIRPDRGEISWDGAEITHESIRNRRIGLVYQDQALFPHMTVRRNVAYGLHSRKLGRAEVRRRVRALAGAVGVDALLDRFPGTLSGGEAQRVALARTLATEPRCLLLDEPISSLDRQARSEMRALLRSLNSEGHTMIHVTHDYEEAVSLASHVGVMENGTIVQVGTPEEVFHRPKSQFVASFVGIRNFFNGRLESPVAEDGSPARFATGGLTFMILTDARPGPGCVIFRSEDVTISAQRTETSAHNCFPGTITDLVPVPQGVEVTIDIGLEVVARISAGSVRRLDLRCGRNVWVSFKAAAVAFIEE